MKHRFHFVLKRWLPFAALLPLALLLTGCRGSLYQDNLSIGGTNMGISPLWIVQIILVIGVLGPVATVILLGVLRPYILPPYYHMKAGQLSIELWVTKRTFPYAALPEAVIAPVAPDLKMNTSAAKVVRDWGASKVQYEANEVAPLKPGDAFLGSGARFRVNWRMTALAVVFDEQKRTNPELFGVGIHTAAKLAAAQGAANLLLPDMTENLMQQPNWVTDAEREAATRQTARLMILSLFPLEGIVTTVKLWMASPEAADIYIEEMERMQDEGLIPPNVPTRVKEDAGLGDGNTARNY